MRSLDPLRPIEVEGYVVVVRFQVEQYLAILKGPTWVGNLICKRTRTALVRQGYIFWDESAVDPRQGSPGAYVAAVAA